MSERVSAWPVVNRSGAIYGHVPTTLPVAVRLGFACASGDTEIDQIREVILGRPECWRA